MKNSFTLIVLSSIAGAAVYSLASEQNYESNMTTDKTAFTLRADCSLLLKECDRIQHDLDNYRKNFQVFNEELKKQGGRAGFLNRSIMWVKSIVSSLDSELRHIAALHGNCLCMSGKVNLTTDLKQLLDKTNERYYQTRNRIMALKSSLLAFRNKIEPNLK